MAAPTHSNPTFLHTPFESFSHYRVCPTTFPPAPPGCFSVTNRRPILGNYQSARHFLPSAHLSLTRISAFECVPLMLSSVPTTSPRLFSEGSGALTGWGRRFARGYKLTFLRPFYTSFDEKNVEKTDRKRFPEQIGQNSEKRFRKRSGRFGGSRSPLPTTLTFFPQDH